MKTQTQTHRCEQNAFLFITTNQEQCNICGKNLFLSQGYQECLGMCLCRKTDFGAICVQGSGIAKENTCTQ